MLEPLSRLQTRLATLDALDLKQQTVKDAITPEHPYFHPMAPLQADVERIEGEIAAAGRSEKAALKSPVDHPKAKFDVARKKLIDAIKARQTGGACGQDLGKLQEERDAREQEVSWRPNVRSRTPRGVRRPAAHLQQRRRSTSLLHLVGQEEVVENEFNLNLPRYVDTFEPEATKPVGSDQRIGCSHGKLPTPLQKHSGDAHYGRVHAA